MDSLIRPIEQVVEASEYFVRTSPLRAMHIITSGLLRNVVLQHLCATELLEVNTCPFFVLESPTDPEDDGWSSRVDELRVDWNGLLESAPDPHAMAPLWPEELGGTSLVRFARELAKALSLLRPPMQGLVIVLAPLGIRDAEHWRASLEYLFGLPELIKARFILVEIEEAHSLPIMAKLGRGAECLDARVDEHLLREDTGACLGSIQNLPAGAAGFQLVGAAGPSAAPPLRKRQRQELSPEQKTKVAQSQGLSAAGLDPDVMNRLRALILSAAQSMRDKDSAEGIRQQRAARDYCIRYDLSREAVINELVLAGYILQAGDPEFALSTFRDGRRRAEQANLTSMAVQAQSAVGSCLLLMGRVSEAAVAYAEAGHLGAVGAAPLPAIEAYRMCGQLLATQKRWTDAAAAFRKALEVADQSSDLDKKSSSAPEAARDLAALCRRHGLNEQADSLEAQAAAIEQMILEAPAEPARSPDQKGQHDPEHLL